MMRIKVKVAAMLVLGGLVWPGSSGPMAQTPNDKWRAEKCQRYGKAWVEALRRFGTTGLGDEFRTRHEAFLASGCTGAHDVCPRSPQEFDMANIMVIQAMNAGTASTFPPFGCR